MKEGEREERKGVVESSYARRRLRRLLHSMHFKFESTRVEQRELAGGREGKEGETTERA